MTTPDPTAQAPRAVLALNGARDARKHIARTEVIARQLDTIAPGTVHVRTVPVWTNRDGIRRRATWVTLDDSLGRPVAVDREAHRAARNLLAHMYPGADWTRPHAYDARTGHLTPDEPAAPADLGLDTQEPRR